MKNKLYKQKKKKETIEEEKQAMQDIKEETAREVQAEKITNNNI